MHIFIHMHTHICTYIHPQFLSSLTLMCKQPHSHAFKHSSFFTVLCGNATKYYAMHESCHIHSLVSQVWRWHVWHMNESCYKHRGGLNDAQRRMHIGSRSTLWGQHSFHNSFANSFSSMVYISLIHMHAHIIKNEAHGCMFVCMFVSVLGSACDACAHVAVYMHAKLDWRFQHQKHRRHIFQNIHYITTMTMVWWIFGFPAPAFLPISPSTNETPYMRATRQAKQGDCPLKYCLVDFVLGQVAVVLGLQAAVAALLWWDFLLFDAMRAHGR